MKFLVIGANAAGMSAASRAKRLNPEIEVTVLEQGQDVSYGACSLPYNIGDPNREIDDLVIRKAEVFREKNNIDLRTGWQVSKLDPQRKEVSGQTAAGEDFRLGYDKLLLATGASPIIPDLPGFDLPGVYPLKTLADGRRIKQELDRVKKAIIIGIGYIGLEMAEALHAKEIQVEMIDLLPQVQPWFSEKLSDAIEKQLQEHGIGLSLNRQVKGIERTGDELQVVCDDQILTADMVVVAIGTRPNSQLADKAGLELGPNRTIAVNSCMQTSDSDIYAAGDCADAFHAITGKRVWIPLALRANRSGWAVADNIVGSRTKVPGLVGSAVFKVFDLETARTGLNLEEAKEAAFDPVAITINSQSRAHAFPGNESIFITMVGDKYSRRLLGVQMVGKEGVAQRINIAAVALHMEMTVAQFAQSDLAYAPPFGPAWDPLLVAANQLLKKLSNC
jgi:NADPH-dependent 2,4-dienoyl-CoA reductase/sulfur reductase-like enzyme